MGSLPKCFSYTGIIHKFRTEGFSCLYSRLCNLFILFLITVWIWEHFLKNGFLLVVIAVAYLQQWQKNKLVYVQYARAVIWIR
jgi:hypothetical protein